MRAAIAKVSRKMMGENSQRACLFLIVLLVTMTSSVLAGKNAGGALIVHTEPWSYYYPICSYPPDIGSCEGAITQTDADENTPALIWVFVALNETADPAISVIHFGNDHNLPQWYHEWWGFCGPQGTIEYADEGWPEFPETAGNTVLFGSPIVGETLFLFYWFSVYGYDGAYYGTSINPTFGYAAFLDDSSPPVVDEIEKFGQIRWYEPGYNECPEAPVPGACCFVTTECQSLLGTECEAAGGEFLGDDSVCDPNPCPLLPEPCCFPDGHCEVFTQIDCDDYGGVWQGPSTACDPNPCPQQLQACCFTDGTCTYVPADECEQAGGTPQGNGTNCEMVVCKSPSMGACCHGDGDCLVSDEQECGAIPDSYLWEEGATCDPNPCIQPAVEENTWGGIKAAYH